MALVVVVVLWRLGHWKPAAILLAVAALATAASSLSPSVADRIHRVESAIERGAGRILTTVLMGAVQLLVFTPLWLLLRLVRHDPLGHSDSDETFWRQKPEWSGPSLHGRPFAFERQPSEGRASRSLRLRAAVGLVAIVAFVDVVVGAAIDRLQDDVQRPSATALTGPEPAAGRGEPWRQVLPEVTLSFTRKHYDPFLGFKVPEFDGRYVNVDNGIRRSIRPSAAGAGRPVSVFLFGGSAMFGAFQRDAHTIPSELVRLARADGIRLRVANYGQPAFANWQEVLLLESLVAAGRKPDLAVFYDGFNELLLQFTLGVHRRPTHLQVAAIEQKLQSGTGEEDPSLYRSWADASALHRLGRTLGVLPQRGESGLPLLPPFAGSQSDDLELKAANAASIYSRGVDLASRLARSYGFRAAFFWQPSIYSKGVLSGEESLPTAAGYDADAWRGATRIARSRIGPPVVDLGDILDRVRKPLMYDVVHTNERGARVVARAVYGRLRSQLEELSGPGDR